MLKAMGQHQVNHHPFAAGLAGLILSPFILAAVLLYGVVFVACVIFKLLFGRDR